MEYDDILNDAIEMGKQQAAAVLKVRDKVIRVKSNTLRGITLSSQPIDSFNFRSLTEDFAGLEQREVLVAEGDSWFSYPGNDILSLLEDKYGFDVEDVAHAGDTIQDMAYVKLQLEKFTRKIEKLIQQKKVPKAILLSGGGNDIAGTEFKTFLNHSDLPNRGLNITLLNEIINKRIKYALMAIISSIDHVCEQRIGIKLPILIHGYDYAVADGRGFCWFGPWLEPGFRAKGFNSMEERLTIIKKLIDQFNEMLSGINAINGFDHVVYLNLRGSLPNILQNNEYQRYWGNELHPTPEGFDIVAKKFVEALNSL
jgi:hypothetical protein